LDFSGKKNVYFFFSSRKNEQNKKHEYFQSEKRVKLMQYISPHLWIERQKERFFCGGKIYVRKKKDALMGED
jgi:hypothetical protein